MKNAHLLFNASVAGLLLAVVAVLFSLAIFPLKYAADARILVAPHAVPGVDPYTSSKSAERIAQNVAEVVRTSQFFNRVVSLTASGIDITYFPSDELERRKLWNRTIDASVAYNSGMLQLTAYHTDPAQAMSLVGAVAQVLNASGNDFAVSPADFRIVDSPVASAYPRQPNFLVIGLCAFFGGFIISAVFLSLRREF